MNARHELSGEDTHRRAGDYVGEPVSLVQHAADASPSSEDLANQQRARRQREADFQSSETAGGAAVPRVLPDEIRPYGTVHILETFDLDDGSATQKDGARQPVLTVEQARPHED